MNYRELVWNITLRGKMGENLLHTCMLHNTADHNELVRVIVKKYPKMVNDVFISEDYYGLSPLHQAIVNEDIEMVYFLLRYKADVHQRCYGSFFCADDQKASRTDSLEHEWVDLVQNTRYTGRMYWGEYPLSFAACTNQHDCFRLLRACKADPNMRDTNGNTVLHLAVIHELRDMFLLAHDLGARLDVKNNQKLTPMALAAKLAKKEMFDLILEIESDVLWNYGNVTCIAFPLGDIDTVDQRTGHLNQASVLSLVVYGDKSRHLDFLDGLLEDLLEAKWRAFGRRRFLFSLAYYVVYDLSFYIALLTRELAAKKSEKYLWPTSPLNSSTQEAWAFTDDELAYLDRMEETTSLPPQCHLWDYGNHNDSLSQTIRLTCECILLILALTQLLQESVDILRNGHKRWWKTVSAFPSKILHKLSFAIVLVTAGARFACSVHPIMLVFENVLVIAAVLITSMHFLFYCRGMKFVGPFVLMVYKIIVGDILRFFLIYLIFVVGFSQFDPFESFMIMFIMSVGEFALFYNTLNDCRSSLVPLGKVMFLIYELLVTVMLLNLLIAMMTRTYEKISETQKEWKRQWAQVILLLEQSLRPHDRLIAMLKYSSPIRSDKAHRSFVVRQRVQPPKGETESKMACRGWKTGTDATSSESKDKTSDEERLLALSSLPIIRRTSAQSASGTQYRYAS
uniref:Ion transport domain-containing protein n=1 Tax=Parascaris univalens TaxID=6257 RepID=A0A915CLI6_PARUN